MASTESHRASMQPRVTNCSLCAQANTLRDLMDNLGLERAVVGQSLGGGVAM